MAAAAPEGGGKKRKAISKCYTCDGEGHMARDCPNTRCHYCGVMHALARAHMRWQASRQTVLTAASLSLGQCMHTCAQSITPSVWWHVLINRSHTTQI
jgi:hypothetical protein